MGTAGGCHQYYDALLWLVLHVLVLSTSPPRLTSVESTHMAHTRSAGLAVPCCCDTLLGHCVTPARPTCQVVHTRSPCLNRRVTSMTQIGTADFIAAVARSHPQVVQNVGRFTETKSLTNPSQQVQQDRCHDCGHAPKHLLFQCGTPTPRSTPILHKPAAAAAMLPVTGCVSRRLVWQQYKKT